MTHEEKVKYMDIALRLCQFNMKQIDIDLMVSLYDVICEKQHNTGLNEIIKVWREVGKRELNKKSKI